jgi:enoyl-[acyl-carrier-protein] reductase (NADH)
MAEPEDIAAVVAFLLGEGARAITGATVAADCGLGVRF